MIPKIIHYCWFGRNPLPDDVKKYIQTWKDKCPDYIIKEWNEDNFDVTKFKFTKEAYALKKYAFVSDVVRVYALLNEGGVYLDTDVEVLKSFDPYLNHDSFIGFELGGSQLGTAVIGSISNQAWMKEIYDTYLNMPFIKWWGKLNSDPNPKYFTDLLLSQGLVLNNERQVIKKYNIDIYPLSFFCAKDYCTKELLVSDYSICVHHYSESWVVKNDTVVKKIKRMLNNIIVKISLF